MSRPLFQLRPAEASDEPFLYSLFASTHGQQFALLPLPPQQLDALIRMQFNAQRQSYRMQFPSSQDFVIVAAGEPAGRLWLDESGDALRVVDIAVAPAQQGNGIGHAVLERVILRATEAAKPVRLSVARGNSQAFELYQRLGFQVTAENEVYLELERAAS